MIKKVEDVYSRSRSRNKTRLGRIEREVLEELTAGDLFVGFLCSARSTRRMYKIAHARATQRYRTKRAIERLVAEGYVIHKSGKVSISKTGRKLLDTTITRIRDSLAHQSWDGKWRIVVFDIPESLRILRDRLRAILKRAGFVKLQHSVWVFPHDCEELTSLIKEDTRVQQHVLYGILERIENSEQLKKQFALRDKVSI